MASRLSGLIALFALVFGLAACGGSDPEDAGPPTAVIRATAQAATQDLSVALQTHLGSAVALDASGSTSNVGGIASYAWTIDDRPAGSTAAVTDGSASITRFVPDVAGAYVLGLKVVDGAGTEARASITVQVSTAPPTPAVVTSVVFAGPSSTLPSKSVPVGSSIVLDGSASTDPGGGVVTLDWAWLDKPAASAAAIAVTGSRASFVPDVAGTYTLRVRGTSASGVSADVVHVFEAGASAPTVLVATSVTVVGSSSRLDAAVGNLVSLTGWVGSGGTGTLTSGWVLVDKPAGSGVPALSSPDGVSTSFVPDLAGRYAARFTVADGAGAQAGFHTVFVDVVQGPTASVSGTVVPVASASGPSFVAATGTPVTLRGTGSFDPSGATLSYAWSMLASPAGSTAVLGTPAAATTTFTPDQAGRYLVQLTVTNPDGISAVQQVAVHAGAYPPVAMVDRAQVALLLGATATASASSSFSPSGNPLAFSWAIDSRPAGSTAAIPAPTSATLRFTPDVAGTYHVTVTVSDGPLSTVAMVSVTALGASSGTVPLTYVPQQVRFSKSLGKAVIVSSDPATLHLVDPGAATDDDIALPAAVKSLNLSADGLYAAVLHEGAVSLVDLAAARLLHSSSAGGSPSDAFVSNAGVIYLVGQTGGQWVDPGFTVIDGRTGTVLQTYSAFGAIYGTTRGIYAEGLHRIFTLSEGLSPADVYATTVDPGGPLLLSTSDSPYHGDYAMSNPLWLSSGADLLFTGTGNYFRTSDLRYAGTLGAAVVSVSHSATADEVLAATGTTNYVYPNGYQTEYAAALKRHTGSLLFPAADVPLPLLFGAQSYGVAVFHRSDDRRVMLVQTGSRLSQAAEAQYYVILR